MKNTDRLAIRISDNLNQKIEHASQKMGISKSDFLRSIIEEKCDQILMGKSHLNGANLDPEYLEKMLWDIGKRVAIIQGVISEKADANIQPIVGDFVNRVMEKWETQYKPK